MDLYAYITPGNMLYAVVGALRNLHHTNRTSKKRFSKIYPTEGKEDMNQHTDFGPNRFTINHFV